MITPHIRQAATPGQYQAEPRDPEKWRAAQDLEASFLAEMLKEAGLGAQDDTLGGGIGAEQFGSFLRQGQAEAMVRAGGIGLAEQFYRSLEKRDG